MEVGLWRMPGKRSASAELCKAAIDYSRRKRGRHENNRHTSVTVNRSAGVGAGACSCSITGPLPQEV